ncbi:MAG: MATE family efflux transporter, partial [Oscillospiraceae bacterium]|nr:MATE family efflux transporter [Oscillospiraceae bacterium]
IPLVVLFEGPYVGLYSIQSATAELVHKMMLCTYFMLPFTTVAYVISKGILRGGGDTRFLLLADSSCVWFISLPLGALAAFVWNLPSIWVFFFLRIEFPLKGIVCFIRYCTGKWIKEIRA